VSLQVFKIGAYSSPLISSPAEIVACGVRSASVAVQLLGEGLSAGDVTVQTVNLPGVSGTPALCTHDPSAATGGQIVSFNCTEFSDAASIAVFTVSANGG